MPTWAYAGTDDAAVARLIQAQLPHATSLFQADGETLARAVSQATREQRAQAPAILAAALTGGVKTKEANNHEAIKRSCDFVTRVFKAAVLAAPEQASALTDVVVARYPEYADQLAAVLPAQEHHVEAYDYKDGVDYKDRADYKDAADYKDRTTAPVAGISDLGAQDLDSGFGIGFGPGFPGSLGFVGSPPSGGFALPPVALPTPGSAPVTSVVNE